AIAEAVEVDEEAIAIAVKAEMATELAHLDADVSSRLAPTTAGRTLDVTAGGAAGIDLANVENATSTLNLSGTTISTSQTLASVTSGVTLAANQDVRNVSGTISDK